MNIKLKKISEKQFEEIYYKNIGIHSDDYYEIELINGKERDVIGLVMISKNNPHDSNKSTFIEWVEIKPQLQGKSLFSKVVENLFILYNTNEIHFESCDKYLSMYFHMKAVCVGISTLTENNMMILNKADFDHRLKQVI